MLSRTVSLRTIAALAVIVGLVVVPRFGLTQSRPVPPPALLVKATEQSEPLKLQRLEADVRIIGHLSETRLTMTFFNPHDRVLAGDLYVPLPEGATVSGYALDVKGVLVDGVVVDKHEARRAFEIEVRRGVDPGLVEWVGGNNFETRVFPIPAGGTRTIMVRYVAEVDEDDNGARFRLPLNYRVPVGSLSVRVEVVNPIAAPTVVAGGPKGLRFNGWRDSYIATAALQNATLEDDLVIALPAFDSSPARLEIAENGAVYFSIREHLTVPPPTAPLKPRTVRLFWDASGSRGHIDQARTIALIRRWLASLDDRPVSVDLVLLRNEAAAARRFMVPAQLDALVKALEVVSYDGGTQMAAIAPEVSATAPDLYLLVTDGISNVGQPDPGQIDAPVYILNEATTANHALLHDLALRSGGAYLNLQRVTDEQVINTIGTRPFSFLGARIEGVPDAELYPHRPRPVHDVFTLAGLMPAQTATVVVEYGFVGKVTHRSRFTINTADAVEGEMLRLDWAQKKVDDLLVFPKQNASILSAVGKTHGIVTPGTSLIVMERLEQYVEHRIRPPKSLPEMRTAYDEAIAVVQREKKRKDVDKLEHVLRLWQDRVAWWETKFMYEKAFRYVQPKEKEYGDSTLDVAPQPALAPVVTSRVARVAEAGTGQADPTKRMADMKSNAEEAPALEPTIVLASWKPDTPYLAALEKAAPAERIAIYMVQRRKYGTAPSFFLDCADFFRRQNDEALALQVLTNIAELELEDPALLRILAHRLAQLDRLDESIRQFERVLRLRPEEPQSYRDLALVLKRRGETHAVAGERASARYDYERALALFARVVMDRWDRFDEIELVALMELNNAWPQANALGVEQPPLDERLIKVLPVDVRIVMTWDADMTDMDLHVIEPSGEEAFFSHNRTTIGGLVSRDFTQGYGPEVYLVRRAMRGTYQIRTKYYGSAAAKLQGAVTLQVDLFTNYGSPNEKRRSITFRLTGKKELFTVGEIEF